MNHIVGIGKYYLYRHIRPDKNEPFYIGIGTKNQDKFVKGPKSEYQRAYNKCSRSKIWWDIVNKNDGKYEVEILMECDDYKFVENKEIEFVKLYGRINLHTGILSNLTDGGDGKVSCVHSQDTKDKMSASHFCRGKFGGDNIKSIKIYQYDLDGIFIKEHIGIGYTARLFGGKSGSITSCLRKKALSAFGYQWFYDYRGEKTLPLKRKFNLKVGVKMIDINTGIMLKEFKTTIEAAKHVNGNSSGIWSSCNKYRGVEFYLGYKWEYKK